MRGEPRMMMVLLDEPTIMLFESPDGPPDDLEAIDVLGSEYTFCDDDGQFYVGFVSRPGRCFRPEEYALRPEGEPDITRAMELVDRAVLLERNPWFVDRPSLRLHLEARAAKARDPASPMPQGDGR
jgi:hypothetical protein